MRPGIGEIKKSPLVNFLIESSFVALLAKVGGVKTVKIWIFWLFGQLLVRISNPTLVPFLEAFCRQVCAQKVPK